MKRVLFLGFLAVVPVLSCFAGNFYSNIVVITENAESLWLIIKEFGITMYYVASGHIGIIFEQMIDRQDIPYGHDLSKRISKKINGFVIYTTNHDSDALVMYVYKNNSEIFCYESCPGYFEGTQTEPKIIGIDSFLNEFQGVSKDDLIKILETPEAFSEDIHMKLFQLLSLPDFLLEYCQFGYEYIESDTEYIVQLNQKFDIKIFETGCT